MTEDCEGAFDKEKDDFEELCACTPTYGAVLERIHRNQERFLEWQQKCLKKFDPTLQQAIEHAGDIIRELSKTSEGEPQFDLAYVSEKAERLSKRLDEIEQEKIQGRRTWKGSIAPR